MYNLCVVRRTAINGSWEMADFNAIWNGSKVYDEPCTNFKIIAHFPTYIKMIVSGEFVCSQRICSVSGRWAAFIYSHLGFMNEWTTFCNLKRTVLRQTQTITSSKLLRNRYKRYALRLKRIGFMPQKLIEVWLYATDNQMEIAIICGEWGKIWASTGCDRHWIRLTTNNR